MVYETNFYKQWPFSLIILQFKSLFVKSVVTASKISIRLSEFICSKL